MYLCEFYTCLHMCLDVYIIVAQLLLIRQMRYCWNDILSHNFPVQILYNDFIVK